MRGVNVPVSAAIVGVVNTLLQLVVSFGVSVTDSQNAAITGLVNSLLVLAGVVEHYRIRNGAKPTPPTPPPAPPAP